MRASLPHSDMVPHDIMGVQMQRRPLLLQVIGRIEMVCCEIKYYKNIMNLKILKLIIITRTTQCLDVLQLNNTKYQLY